MAHNLPMVEVLPYFPSERVLSSLLTSNYPTKYLAIPECSGRAIARNRNPWQPTGVENMAHIFLLHSCYHGNRL
jgi:hypothetical protein